MHSTFIIKKYTTHITLNIPVTGSLGPGINIENFINEHLTVYEFSKKYRKYFKTKRFCVYDHEKHVAIFPINVLNDLKSYLELCYIKYIIVDVPPNEADDIIIETNPKYSPRSSLQLAAIEFLIKNDRYIKPIDLNPGVGKTGSSIYAICKIKKRTIIFASGLEGQWFTEILKFTKLRRKDILIVKGFNGIKYLTELKKIPKIIIVGLFTANLWINRENNYNSVMPYSEFICKAKIGIKIMDECHTKFYINTIIDLYSNMEHNLYLSATYARSNDTEQRIFEKIFPNNIIFTPGDVAKYICTYFYNYSLGLLTKLRTNTTKGYNHPKYEQYIYNNNQRFELFMEKVILSIIQKHYLSIRNPKQKMLILTSTTLMVYKMMEYLQQALPSVNIKSYVYKDSDNNLNDGVDIIISTPHSAGVGRDIKKLKTTLNTVSLASNPLTRQIFGRLRELKNDTPYFIDIFNRDIDAHCRHHKRRSEIYRRYSKEYIEKTIV